MATTFNLVYNYDTRRLVQSVSDYNTPLLDSELPYIYYGMENVLIRFTVIDNTGVAKDLSSGVVNKFATIKDSANETESSLVTSSRINENGTWIASANPALTLGQVTVIFNTVTAELLDKLNTNRYITSTRIQVKLRDVNNYLLFPIDIPCKCLKEDSTVDDITPPTPDSGYMSIPGDFVENNIVTFSSTGNGKNSGYKLNDSGINTTSLWSANKIISYVATVGGISSGGTSTNNAIVLWNGTGGGILKDSAVLLPASGLVGITEEQTLTNKTLTSPVINMPTGITADDVGLDEVDNTSDADKPISTLTQASLDLKVDKVTGKVLSTNDYTTSEKNKLSGIEAGANLYVHPVNHPASIITQDTSNRFVTDVEKSTWNSKQGALGFTAVANTITVNGHALSSNVVVTKADIGLSNVTNYDTTNPINIIQSGSYRFVTDAEKSTWNAKQPALGFTAVPNTRTVNGHPLSSNVTITKTDLSLNNVVNLDTSNPVNISQTSSYRFVTDAEKSTWNGKQDAIGYTAVPTTRTVNGHALSSNVTIIKSDINLGNVTDDAQLKRSANDYGAISAKTTLVDGDIYLIEDVANSYNKKKTSLLNTWTYIDSKSIVKYTVGASSSTDNAVAIFDGTGGKTIKNSSKLLPYGTIVGTTDTQTLTNKSITAPIVSNYLEFTNLSVNPATPSAGYIKVFTKTDGHTYAKNSSGVIIPLDTQVLGYPETTTFTNADIGKPIVAGTPSYSDDVQLRNVGAVSTFSVDSNDNLNIASGTGTTVGQIHIAFVIPSTGLTTIITNAVLSTLFFDTLGTDFKLIAYDGTYDRTATPPNPTTILATSSSIASGKVSELVSITSSVSAFSQSTISLVLSITTPSSYSASDISMILESFEVYDSADLSKPLFTWGNHVAITTPAGSTPNDYALCGVINSDALAELGDGVPVYDDFGTLYTVKTTPANSDRIAINDSADTYAMKYISISSLNYRYVVGSAGSINNNFVAFDGTTGKLIKDSGYSASSLTNIPSANEKAALDGASPAITAGNPVASIANLATKADLVGGLVPTSQLPGFTAEVKEFADYASLPTTSPVAASVIYDTVTFTAVTAGEIGNAISLVFDGLYDIDSIVYLWNIENPTNTVGFTGQAGTYIPTAGTADLVGGVDAASTGVIYITLDDSKQYRWGGTVYVELSASLVLGETAGTAYVGNKGKTAYDHSQLTSGNPHSVTKTDVSLSNVQNTKVNLAAVVAPIGTDDNTAGYSVGSNWVDTITKLSYDCVDATTGNAIWNVKNSGSMDNIGTGTGIYSAKVDEEFQLKSLTSTGGTIALSSDSTTVNLEAVGNNSVIPFVASFTSASSGAFTWNDNVLTVVHGRDNEFNMIALYNDTTNVLLDYPIETINSNSLKVYFPIGIVPVADTYKIVCSNVGGNHTSIVQNYEETDESVLLSREKQIYTKNVTTTTTFTFDTSTIALITGEACTFEIDLTMAVVSTINFPVSVIWLYGTPLMDDTKIYRLVFHSIDQGTTWYGNLAFEREII